MVAQFIGKEQDQPFKDWLAQPPHGFYLNERGQGEVMLHKVDCWHHGSGEGFNSTTKFKIGSDNREELEEWAKENFFKVAPCRHCKP